MRRSQERNALSGGGGWEIEIKLTETEGRIQSGVVLKGRRRIWKKKGGHDEKGVEKFRSFSSLPFGFFAPLLSLTSPTLNTPPFLFSSLSLAKLSFNGKVWFCLSLPRAAARRRRNDPSRHLRKKSAAAVCSTQSFFLKSSFLSFRGAARRWLRGLDVHTRAHAALDRSFFLVVVGKSTIACCLFLYLVVVKRKGRKRGKKAPQRG